jgi:transcriptional repressor NrdR
LEGQIQSANGTRRVTTKGRPVRCPFCSAPDSRVVDSREANEGRSIRRRRECAVCGRRFTTYENIEAQPRNIVKRDGRREPFNPAKLQEKLRIALTKRPVPTAEIERIVREIERDLFDGGASEVPSTAVGELVLAKLRELDQVAYIRFASVYREFKDLDDWRRQVEVLDSRPTDAQ